MTLGCADVGRRHSLQSVAKDWCETIRASQVLPVYPLSEDLRPGDVFFVQSSAATEAERYKAKGFLPLDDFHTRLPIAPTMYDTMYFDGYWEDVFSTGTGNPRPRRKTVQDPTIDANAPRAAFPSYSFDVSTSSGLAMAIPIKGVPVAMNFLRADKASGSITLNDARTYSADPGAIESELRNWIDRPEIRDQLNEITFRNSTPSTYGSSRVSSLWDQSMSHSTGSEPPTLKLRLGRRRMWISSSLMEPQ